MYAGHHVFSTESQTDLDDWIDSINNAIQEDKRLQRRKSKSKTKMAEEARSLSTLHTERSSGSIGSTGSGSVPHPTTLMGRKFKNIYSIHPSALQMCICTHSYSKCIIFSCNACRRPKTRKNSSFFLSTGVYQVVVDDNDFSSKIGARGVCKMNVGPRGLKLVTDDTGSTLGAWHYKRIRSYSKSANRQVILDIGTSKNGSPGGKLILSSSSSKEMFSMIHRNIKLLRAMREKALAEKESSEATEVKEILKTKQQPQQQEKRISLISRPRSMAYELGEGTEQSKRVSYPSFAEQQTVGSDLIQLEGFTDGAEDDEEFQKFLESLDPIMQPPVLESVEELTNEVYDSPSDIVPPLPPQNRSTQSPFPPPNNASNPFLGMDPFTASPQGSFYNSKEDIFENFDNGDQKTSTPSKSGSNTNPFLAMSVATQQPKTGSKNPFAPADTLLDEDLKELENPEKYTYARPVKPKKMSQQEFDKVWEDITADLHLPP